jgi:type IX secretion system PorP/SprF family membrane protein
MVLKTKNNNYLVTAFLLMLFVFSGEIWAQYRPYSAFYNLNPAMHNPAGMGTQNTLSGSLFYRAQMLGIKDAPHFQGMQITLPISNFYIGVNYQRNATRAQETNELATDFGYKLNLSVENKHELTFGLGSVVNLNTYKPRFFSLKDPDDPVFTAVGKFSTQAMFNVRIGVWYVFKDFYVSLSSPALLYNHVVQKDGKFNGRTDFNFAKSQLFLQTGYNVNISENLSVEFNVNYRYNAGFHKTDVLALFRVNDIVSLGAYYTTVDQMGSWLSVEIVEALHIMYHFGFGFNPLYYASKGTHEVGLLWKVPKRNLIAIKNSRLTN